tara:strand:- start:2165 stop:2482 length:318 start_codon:yes stop_codon:yes gene_type:complete
MKPQLSNSRITLTESIGPTDHVNASCWLNITDHDLLARLEQYMQTAGKKGRPNIQLELVLGTEGQKTYRKVGSFQLFLNDGPHPLHVQATYEPDDGGGGGGFSLA